MKLTLFIKKILSLLLMSFFLASCATKTIVVYRDIPKHTELVKDNVFYPDCEVCGEQPTRMFHGGKIYKLYGYKIEAICAVMNCEFSYRPFCNKHEPAKI